MQPETHEKLSRLDRGGHSAPSNSGSAGAEDELESWKEIAGFIGKDERTAMRWAKEQGMPVRKFARNKGNRIYGSKAEISKWLQERSVPEPHPKDEPEPAAPGETSTRPFPKARVVAGISLALLAVAIVAIRIVGASTPPLPSQVTFGEDSVEALDVQGRRLWTHRFGRRLHPVVLGKPLIEFVRIADLMGDGHREVLVVAPFRLGSNPSDPGEIEVDCFSADGRLLWSHIPKETFRFGDHELRGWWTARDLLLTSRGSAHQIWVAFGHYEWGNSYIANLDPGTGHATLRYVNTGDITSLAEIRIRQATYLLVGSFNNEHDGGSLAMVDEGKPFASSPQTTGTRHKCASCPSGESDYYFVLPRSELNLLRKAYEDPVGGITVDADGLGFTAHQRELGLDSPDIKTLYKFRSVPNPIPISVRFGSAYDMLHRELERTHQLDHRLEACPERLHPRPIRRWTPSEGWTEISLKPSSFNE